MVVYDLGNMPYRLKREGVEVKAVSGERCQMVLVRLEKGFASDHGHPEEQIGLVVRGTISLTIDGKTSTCGPGYGYRIPAGARHSFKVTSADGAEIIDIFSPPKDENK